MNIISNSLFLIYFILLLYIIIKDVYVSYFKSDIEYLIKKIL